MTAAVLAVTRRLSGPRRARDDVLRLALGAAAGIAAMIILDAALG